MRSENEGFPLLPTIIIVGVLAGSTGTLATFLAITHRSPAPVPVVQTVALPTPPAQAPSPAWDDGECFTCRMNDDCSDMVDGTQCNQGNGWLTCRNGRWIREDALLPPKKYAPTSSCRTGRPCEPLPDHPDAYCEDLSGRRYICCFRTLIPRPSNGHCPSRI